MADLLIEAALPALRRALAGHRSAVLQAPPGAGKTTRVPDALLDEPWLGGRSIVMLEPRRLAARAAAARLAERRGEPVGETVGYRMRGDSRVGPRTRIEVVTEGVLTRRIVRDPTLEDVGLLIFDEFHERSLNADLGLALALRTQELLRDDLRLLVMSATLDGAAVAAMLGDAPIVTSEGSVHPVETRYAPPPAPRSPQRPRRQRIDAGAAAAVAAMLPSTTGDVLVFLPGAGEIRGVQALLGARDLGGAVVVPLHGTLSHDEQDRALRPDPERRRKIVLATSIAETSLSIDGVRAVVDAGFARAPRFSPRTGMTRLETTRVSRASADQRRGRAGRVAPGVCVRLWAEHENAMLLEHAPPEIAGTDLAPLALDLAAAGVHDPAELRWLDPPAPAAFGQAVELLRELDAVDGAGTITAHGRRMASIATHPRLAHMLLRARDLGDADDPTAIETASAVAALLGERDVLRPTRGMGTSAADGVLDADLSIRLELLRDARPGAAALPADVDQDALRRVRQEASRLTRQVGEHAAVRAQEPRPAQSAARASRGARAALSIGALVALAYPDRVAQRRAGERARYLLRNGRGAELTGAQSLAASPYLAIAEVDDRRPESRVFLAAALDADDVRTLFGDQIVERDEIVFDRAAGAVVARRRAMLGALVLRESTVADADPDAVRAALIGAARDRGMDALPWSEAARRLRDRMAFAARLDDGWPDVSDHALDAHLDEWLGPSLDGVRRLDALDRVDLADALGRLLDWRQRRALDEIAPSHIEVPTGSRIAVDYTDPAAPVLAVRLQEVFGMTETPRVGGGRVPVTMHLLSPSRRPMQVTQDLAGFWRTSYFDIRREMRGRYPKHDWPEDPLTALPTRRAKPRR
jgi:ATP-dependent helicase HrpB